MVTLTKEATIANSKLFIEDLVVFAKAIITATVQSDGKTQIGNLI